MAKSSRSICVVVVVGTRPEAIKMAPVIRLAKERDDIDLKLCVTGQHEDMMDQVLSDFELEVACRFNAMRDSKGITDVLGLLTCELGHYLSAVKPDVVLVHGDTASTLAGALAGYYAAIPVGHVEAGLRTPSIMSPWPEEGNRRLVSQVASIHFAPTALNAETLLSEGHSADRIHVTGNTVVDALLLGLEISSQKYEPTFQSLHLDHRRFVISSRKYVLITAHRRENHGKNFTDICHAIRTLSKKYPAWDFVFPVHPNPVIRKAALEQLEGENNIYLLEPQNYMEFLRLMDACEIVISDSGGIQEEAPSLGKRVLVLRETTERMEAVESGHVKLVGTAPDEIIKNVTDFIEQEKLSKIRGLENPFGDGLASIRILDALVAEFAC